MTRTPPPSAPNEVWYVVPGRRPRPRIWQRRPEAAVPHVSGGKAREASRGSRSEAAPADKGHHRRREGRGEGPDGPLAGEMSVPGRADG